MILSIYLVLCIAAFGFLFGSLFNEGIIRKVILAGIAIPLFVAVSIASLDIEIVQCTDTACTLQQYVYDDLAFLFNGMVYLSIIITFGLIAFAVYQIIAIRKEANL